MRPNRPNIVYLHTHDAGRYIEPYGYAVPTPNLMRFARQGMVFRNMHCAAPTCSPSRIAMLTGQAPHCTGSYGLAHRGWSLRNTEQHLTHMLRSIGYTTALAGTQHEHTDAFELGYDAVLADTWNTQGAFPGKAVEVTATDFLAQDHEKPFFLSVGFDTTHRTFPDPLPSDDESYCRPPEPLPDNALTRRDMACYKRAASILDEQMGRVLQALDDHNLTESTLVICTTDHGLAFPMMKCNLTDFGTGVFFMMRWPGVIPAETVSDALVSQIDLLPTLFEWLDLPSPDTFQGASLVPLLSDPGAEIHDEIFAEVTFHAATEPMRSVRTHEYLYIRRWDSRLKPVGTNIDVSYTKAHLVQQGLPERPYAAEELYDLRWDPMQRNNIAGQAAYQKVLTAMQQRLASRMTATGDILSEGLEHLPENPDGMDPECFTGNVGGAPLPELPQRLRHLVSATPRPSSS